MPEHLIEGLRRFRAETFPRYREHYERLVADGQSPQALFIGCADSRVLPDVLTSTGPGDLFVVRNVGAFVPAYEPESTCHATAAGIEFAVQALEVTDIVVCGHSHCGAVAALYAPPVASMPHLARWLEHGHDARVEDWSPAGDGTKPDRQTLLRTERRSVALQVGRLLTYPDVRERVEAGTLSLHGWHYVIEEARIHALDVAKEAFVELTA